VTTDDFVAMLRDELGMPISAGDLHRQLDDVPGWDSMHLVWLIAEMELRTGRRVSLPNVLEAPDLAGVHALYVAAR
jgi:hypothetical protein